MSSGAKDRYAVGQGEVVVVRAGKQIAGPKRPPEPKKTKR